MSLVQLVFVATHPVAVRLLRRVWPHLLSKHPPRWLQTELRTLLDLQAEQTQLSQFLCVHRALQPWPAWGSSAGLGPVCQYISCTRGSKTGHGTPDVASEVLHRGERSFSLACWLRFFLCSPICGLSLQGCTSDSYSYRSKDHIQACLQHYIQEQFIVYVLHRSMFAPPTLQISWIETRSLCKPCIFSNVTVLAQAQCL